jgi:hypothetical protein
MVWDYLPHNLLSGGLPAFSSLRLFVEHIRNYLPTLQELLQREIDVPISLEKLYSVALRKHPHPHSNVGNY